MRRFLLALPLLLAPALTGCADPPDLTATPVSPKPASTPWLATGVPVPSTSMLAPSPSTAPLVEDTITGTFLAFPQGTRAITYNPEVVPAGATVKVAIARTANGTSVRLAVTGMVPRRTYGAHLHRKSCTATPADAGPHYQHDPDPKAAASPPSVDPSFANPRNEVWLDFTTDDQGVATATAVQEWAFDEIEPPRSLIVHAQYTRIGPGRAGIAGARVACLTLGSR